jgi:hypothetical protein
MGDDGDDGNHDSNANGHDKGAPIRDAKPDDKNLDAQPKGTI